MQGACFETGGNGDTWNADTRRFVPYRQIRRKLNLRAFTNDPSTRPCGGEEPHPEAAASCIQGYKHVLGLVGAELPPDRRMRQEGKLQEELRQVCAPISPRNQGERLPRPSGKRIAAERERREHCGAAVRAAGSTPSPLRDPSE